MDELIYVFVDTEGNIADTEALSPSEAQLRNAYAAPGQALEWRLQTDFIAEMLATCVEHQRVLRGSLRG